jgi:hypothetical protein
MTSEEKETAVDVFDMKIQQLNFSARTHNCLRRAGINTLGDLCRLSEGELKNGSIRNLGPQSLEEIKTKLAAYGLELGLPDKEIILARTVQYHTKELLLNQIRKLQELKCENVGDMLRVSNMIKELAQIVFDKKDDSPRW